MTVPPWLSVLPSIAAFLPLIYTVEEKVPDMAWPQPAVSPRRAAGRLQNRTVDVRWPGTGRRWDRPGVRRVCLT